MTTKTKTIVVRDGFTRLLDAMRQHWTQPLAGKCAFDEEQLEAIRAMADELGIQPEVKEVPDKPTDGELLAKAKGLAWEALGEATRSSLEAEADTFLRLVRERDGEPWEVDDNWLWWELSTGCVDWKKFAKAVNAHRGVRPEKPLPKVTGFATLNGVLHTFETRVDFAAFLAANGDDCNMLGRPDNWVHHAALAKEKDGE